MLDRGKAAAVGGVAALIVLTGSGVIPILVGILGFTGAYAYAAYWGLTIRRKLVMPDYKSQALAASSPPIVIVLTGVAAGALPVSAGSGILPILVNAAVDFGLVLVGLYWVNTSVSLARRSDPLERDTLHFSAARYPWALLVILPAIAALARNPLSLVFTVAVPLDTLSIVLAEAPYIVLFSYGTAVLLLGASRSMNRTLTTHFRWFAGAFGFSIIDFVGGLVWRTTGGNSSPYGSLVIDPLFIGGQFLTAYCFYRSAKALVSISKAL